MWAHEIGVILKAVLRPEFSNGVIILSIAAVLTFAASLRLSGGAFGLKFTAWQRILPLSLVGFGLALAGVTAIRIYALDADSTRGLAMGLQIGILLIVLLAVVVPIASFLLKGNYIESALAVAASIVASLLVTMLLRGAIQAVVAGGEGMQGAKDRREQMQDSVTKDL